MRNEILLLIHWLSGCCWKGIPTYNGHRSDLCSCSELRGQLQNCQSPTRMMAFQSKLLSFIYFRYLQVLRCFCSFNIESNIPYKLRDLSRIRDSICSPRCQPVVNSCQDTGPHGKIHRAGHAIGAASCAQSSVKGQKGEECTKHSPSISSLGHRLLQG